MRSIESRPWQTTVLTLASVVLLAPASPAGGAGEPAVEAWGRVLAAYARDGGIDYAGLKADPADLDLYLSAIGSADPSGWSEEAQIAFWSNAYNAVVARFVIDRYPEIESVRDVDGFFKELRFLVAGEELSLDEIETRGRDLGDPRVHFAVVCASTSCPGLRGEPFVPERLDAQLEEQTRIFLADPENGMRYDADDNKLHLSSIFMWYAGDFTGGSTMIAYFARSKVLSWIVDHLPAELAATLEKREPGIRYLDYDWTLNDRPATAAP